MNSRVLIVCGSLMLATACDSPRPFAPTVIVPPPSTAVPAPTGAAGPFGPASNPAIAAGTLIEGTVTEPISSVFPIGTRVATAVSLTSWQRRTA